MSDQWVLLRRCASIQEAVVLRSVLEGAGVECVMPDEHTLGVHPGLTYLGGGVRLLVRAGDLERAHEILEAAEDG